MSVTTVVSTENQLNNNFDQSVVFLGRNRYESADYTNSTGGEVTLAIGTLMGRVAATGKLLPLKSAATDGSEYPAGILTKAVTVADTVTVNVSIAVAGDVAEDKIVFDGSDTISTIVDGRQLRDRIAADTVGIKVVSGTELTGFDN